MIKGKRPKAGKIASLNGVKVVATLMVAVLAGASASSHAKEVFRFPDIYLESVDEKDFTPPMDDFVVSAKRAGASIEFESCRSMYRARQADNVLYVASCKLKGGISPVMVCNASITNAFALAVTSAISPEDSREFMLGHCSGG